MQRTQANVEYLQRFGPATLDELPKQRVTTNNKQAGVAKFDPHVGTYGDQSTQVYYLFDDHSPRRVVDRWLTANADHLTDTPDRVIVRNCGEAGSQFGDAAHKLLGTNRTD